MSAPIRAIIADDEPIARELIARLLTNEQDIVVVDICHSGKSAVDAVKSSFPDLVFLDIRMPDLDGLEVIRNLPPQTAPLFILITAFAEHAIEAFEVRAFDYVLKPIEKSRFSAALNSARVAIHNRRTLAEHATGLDQTDCSENEEAEFVTHLKIRAGDRIVRLPVEAIRYFEACSQYVRADFGTGSYLISTESLGSLEAKLARDTFHRVHRSYLVGSDHVDSIVSGAKGGMWALLNDGRQIPISRRNRNCAEALMIAVGNRKHGRQK